MRLSFPIKTLEKRVKLLQKTIKERESSKSEVEMNCDIELLQDDIDNANEQIEQHQNAIKILLEC